MTFNHSATTRRTSPGSYTTLLDATRFSITEFPLLRALAPVLASYDGAAELDRFLDLLLPGLTASLAHAES